MIGCFGPRGQLLAALHAVDRTIVVTRDDL
jgi:hypothetical protein